jgi:hypothetical protein
MTKRNEDCSLHKRVPGLFETNGSSNESVKGDEQSREGRSSVYRVAGYVNK